MVGFYFAGGCFVKDGNRLKNAKELNQGSQNLDQYILEQVEISEYKQLIKVINAQLFNLLNPLATYYSEYDADNKGLQMKEIKAEPSVVDSALKIGGKEFFSTIAPVNEELYGKLTTDSMVVFSTLTDLTGGANPESVSESIGKTLNVKSYLRLAYMIDGQLYGTSVIVLKEAPDHSVMKLLKTYAYFTSMTLKRILTEETLRRSEQELRTIAENMTDVVAMADVEGRFVYISESSQAVFGYRPEEFIGKSITELVHEDDVLRVGTTFQEGITEGKKSASIEHRVRNKNGSYIWVEAIGSLIIDDNGQPSGVLFVSRDISDRKHAQEQIERLAQIADNAPSSILVHDYEGNIFYANEHTFHLYGYIKEEFMKLNLRDIGAPESAELIPARMKDIKEKGEAEFEVRQVRKDSSTFPLQVYVKQTEWFGKPALLSVSKDISERKKVELDLAESENKFKTLFQDSLVSIIVFDKDTGEIVDANVRAWKSYGLNSLTELQKDDFWMEPPYSAKESLGWIRKSLNEGVQVFEWKNRKVTGEIFWEQIMLRPTIINGIERLISSATEITDRKQAEESLKESEGRNRAILNVLPDIMFIYSREGYYLDYHASDQSLLAVEPEQFIGKSVNAVLPQKVAEMFLQGFERVYETNQLQIINYTLDLFSGLKHFEARITLMDEQRLIAIIRDITDRKQAEAELADNEKSLKEYKQRQELILDNIKENFWSYNTDQDGNFISSYISPAGAKMLGITEEELNHSFDVWFSYILPEDLDSVKVAMDETMKNVVGKPVEYRVKGLDGTVKWIRSIGNVVHNQDGTLSLIGSGQDITERKLAEEELLKSSHLLNTVQQLTKVGGWEWDVVNQTMTWTDETYRIHGISPGQVPIGSPEHINMSLSCYDPKDLPIVKKDFERCLEYGEPYDREYPITKITGERIWTRATAEPVIEEGRLVRIIGNFMDITERKIAEEKIIHIGFHDQLTDLYNRHYFEACEEELKDIPVLSVIMTDVNGLKLINDTYGHEAGDELLKKYAELLKKSFKQSDLIFRWGGDEFIVILKNTKEAKSWELCNRLVKYCGESFVKDIPLSISIGISSKLQGGHIDEAIKEAEDMMYKNKLTESKSSKNLIMKTLQQTLSEKSFETKEHIDRMTLIGRQFGEKLGLSPSELSRLETLTMLHDIGKINIDSHILLKETVLSDEEWEEIKKHPEVGYRITRTTEEFAYVAEDILAHHERWDGKGYPQGLEGEGIPHLSRLLNLIDSYDVMSNGRPYKKKMSLAEVIEEIERCSGKQFDPNLAKEFVACLREL